MAGNRIQHWEKQRDASGPPMQEKTPNTYFHRKGGGGDGGHLKVPCSAPN